MPWLLDTNILIAISKRDARMRPQLERHAARDMWLSSVVLAEIEYGIAKSTRREHNRQVFDVITGAFKTVSFDPQAARQYGEIRVALERRGQVIGPNDLMIAAQALALDAVLVSANVREFSRVPGLRLENWLCLGDSGT